MKELSNLCSPNLFPSAFSIQCKQSELIDLAQQALHHLQAHGYFGKKKKKKCQQKILLIPLF